MAENTQALQWLLSVGWILVILSACWWGIQLVGIFWVRRGVPRLDAPTFKDLYTKSVTDDPSVSIIVPARNEEHYVEEALQKKLSADYPNLEVVFVDDRSTDRTGNIADALSKTDRRLSVIHLESLPTGWLGKVHALHKGAQAATGEWLLFTDADVPMSGDLLKRAMALAIQEDLDHLTAVPAISPKSPLLTLALTGFIRALMILTRSWATINPNSSAFFGCGAFNLVKRAALEKTPGLQFLKMEISDDAAFGAMMKAYGAKQRTALLGGLSRLEFYPNLKSMFTGLEKNGAMTPWPLIPIIVTLLLSIELGYVAGWLLHNPALLFAGTLVYCIAAVTQLTASITWSAPRWSALFPGFGTILFSLAALRSGFLAAIRRGAVWRGTFYSTKEVRKGAVLPGLVKRIKRRNE